MSTPSILTEDSLRRIKEENDSPKQVHGRPVKLISDLLETIYHLKKEKKKWQSVAEKRRKSLRKIQEITLEAFQEVTDV